ncbi:ABC transporter ATP-binding protein OS=Streptomyces tendae OX=1932 GN=GUR47_05250 PE=4 SV=1 [Streptomyces tendae]
MACGEPAEVLTKDLVAKVYPVDARITRAGPDDRPHVRFLGTLPG